MKATILLALILLFSNSSFSQDSDLDGIPNSSDNCADVANPDQLDSDFDGAGDACDLCYGDDTSGDSDGDGICDSNDQCPGFDDTADADGDGSPDGCDICFGDDTSGDTDGDGVCDSNDLCPGFDDSIDTDADGSPDACDLCLGDDTSGDTDGDGVCDNWDNCPGFDDGIDADGDGTPDGCDECAGFPDNADADADNIPDGCDVCWGEDISGDSDGDGVCDNLDACSGDDSSGDMDGDGICDDIDMCTGDDFSGDTDGDGLCDDYDPILFPQDITACNSYTWVDGTVFTNSVSNVDHYALNPNGHDTIYLLNLTIIDVNLGIIEGGEGQDLYLFSQQDDASYVWFDCQSGISPQGATDQMFFPPASGSYAVEISYQGCVTTSECYEFGFAGLDPTDLILLEISPNPAQQVLKVKTSDAYGQAYHITDLTGKVVGKGVLSGIHSIINLSSLTDGVYLFNTANQVRRFMVAR